MVGLNISILGEVPQPTTAEVVTFPSCASKYPMHRPLEGPSAQFLSGGTQRVLTFMPVANCNAAA